MNDPQTDADAARTKWGMKREPCVGHYCDLRTGELYRIGEIKADGTVMFADPSDKKHHFTLHAEPADVGWSGLLLTSPTVQKSSLRLRGGELETGFVMFRSADPSGQSSHMSIGCLVFVVK